VITYTAPARAVARGGIISRSVLVALLIIHHLCLQPLCRSAVEGSHPFITHRPL